MGNIKKIGLGGSCHWCTEAVFQILIGVDKVDQGWISSTGTNKEFSEAVLVHYNPDIIDLSSLIDIHLHTHSCTSDHSMRKKYRSAIYVYNDNQKAEALQGLKSSQEYFPEPIITEVLPIVSFKLNQEKYLDYYKNNKGNQFCTNYITPKFKILMERFTNRVDQSSV